MNTEVEFAKLWESDIPGIELFSARLFRHTFAKHFHEEYTIGINDGGQGRYTYRGEARRSYPGSFNLLNPGEIHTGQADPQTGWIFRNIYVTVPQVKQILTQLEWKGRELPYFNEPVVCDPRLQASFCALFQALNQPHSLLAQQSLMLEVFAQLFQRYAESHHPLRSPQVETKTVALIRAYLEAHYAENVSIHALAQLVGLSPYYLIRTFHQQVGLPPHCYQRHCQLLQAKRSLRTSKSLSEIAVENGFYDQSHLNRTFKRAFGITPGQYRKSNSVQYG